MLKNFFSRKIFQILVYFYVKTASPPEKFHPHLPQQPSSKNCDHVKPAPFFENLVGDSTPQHKWKGSHYVVLI